MALKNYKKEDNFFIIDSNNLETIQTKLYGYCIQDEKIINWNENYNKEITSKEGAYIYVKRSSEKIEISQDFAGFYCLYIYQKDKYFAISNSFLYLAEYLKDKYKLTFNKDYSDAFIISKHSSLSYSDTMINEIKILDRSAIVKIDIPTKKLKIEYDDFLENTINPDSKEGMEILDNWYVKWVRIIKRLKQQNEFIMLELTGGFDSRLSFGLVRKSNILLNEILINSRTMDILSSDYDCANNIANRFGFKINNPELNPKINFNYSMNDIMEMIMYPKGCRHQLVYPNYSNINQYIITGYCGECIRLYWKELESQFINDYKFDNNYKEKISKAEKKQICKSKNRIFKKSLKAVKNKFAKLGRKILDKDIVQSFYRETCNRNHFGGLIIENYQCGTIRLAPLSDLNLNKLTMYNNECKDKNLLLAILYVRYNADLLEIPFGNKKNTFNKSTIEYAKKVSEKYPYNFSDKDFEIAFETPVEQKQNNEVINNIQKVEDVEFTNYMKNLYADENLKRNFRKKYSESIYKYLGRNIEQKVRHPLQGILIFYSISKVIQLCKESEKNSALNVLLNKLRNYIFEFTK